MRILNVAEKPSMARQIANLLSEGELDSTAGKNKYCRNFIFGYTYNGQNATMVMTSVLGHLKGLDFPPGYSDWHAVPYENLFSAPVVYEISANMKEVAENLRIEARKAQMLIIWTDCDREGEYIGSEIVQICTASNSRLDVFRARYSVLNTAEMHRSVRNLSRLDSKQVAAAELRSELDLRSGAAFTRLQTISFKSRLVELCDRVVSYGSCQFPTLGFVVEQYLRVINFVEEDFWYLHLELAGRDHRVTKFTWERSRIFDRAIGEAFLDSCRSFSRAKIISVDSKPTSKWRPVPLRTVEFQKFGSRYLKISSDKIMEIAEKLYNQGYISYPRTETDMFENNFDLYNLIGRQTKNPKWAQYAQSLLDGRFKSPRRGKNNDKAHPPIHPTKDGASLTGVEAKVYEFIARRFLACCSDDAKGLETIVLAAMGNETFRARGIMVEALNYLEVYVYENWNDQSIGMFQAGDMVDPKKLDLQQGATTAPKLLSEAELIGTMDKNGIGTDATIHEHIKKIIERNYVVKSGADSRFHPTNLGLALVLGYDQVGLDDSLTKPKLRALLEECLSAICMGIKSKDQVATVMISKFKILLQQTMDNIEVIHRALTDHSANGLFEPAPLNESSTRTTIPRRPRAPSFHDRNNFDRGDDNDDGNDDGGGGGGSGASPSCPCGTTNMTKRVTKKPGPNKDRAFWTCVDCKYFCWVGQEMAANGNGTKEKDERDERIGDNDKTRGRVGAGNDKKFALNNTNTGTLLVCNCGVAAVEKKVIKEGPNQGKFFATCAKSMDKTCTFFFWLDEKNDDDHGPQSRSKTNNSNTTNYTMMSDSYQNSASSTSYQRASKFGHDRTCSCEMEAVREVTRNGANSGRAYFKCPKMIQKCNYFEWEDEIGNVDRGNNDRQFVARASSTRTAAKAGGASISCYKCGEEGHFANSCSNKENSTNDQDPKRSGRASRKTFRGGKTKAYSGKRQRTKAATSKYMDDD